jgi:hypothetical protein
MNKIYVLLLLAFGLSSCLTGGFDENEQLDELNGELAKAPKVETIMVNGAEVERNTQSRRVIDAKIGDVLNFDVALTSGKNATLAELEFFRVYYYTEDFQEDPQPVDPTSNGIYPITGDEFDFTYSYTVPEEDDDGFHFDPGYIIQVWFRVRNSIGNYGYKAVEIHIVE